jgi:hypothetical protein
MKTAIIILSDPKTGGEESLGRLFNALAAAYDYKHDGQEVSLYFQGTGTRWVEELIKEDHPGHELFMSVKDKVAGVSAGCAEVFGGRPSGFDLISDNLAPGTAGLPSFPLLQKGGYQLLIF